MCLYPGIYTPGIPLHAVGSAEVWPLANLSPPSDSASDMSKNAYIMNLTLGGYIDGQALESQYDNNDDSLDINPSTCGHLVNHGAAKSNVEVFSFAWHDILDMGQSASIAKEDDYFPIPNELRADGSPWYYDTALAELVSFPRRELTPLPHKMLCGAALISTTPISKGEELLLDYGLREPYPLWAKGWYVG